MGRDLELKSGSWQAVVSPDRGGRLRWLGRTGPAGREAWIRPLQSERGGLVGGGAARLAPPSQVEEATAQHVPDPASFDEPWQLTQQMPDRVTLMLHPRGPSPGSWGYQASQTLRLEENRLEWTLCVRNLSRMPMPARLGWQLQFPDDFAEALWLDDTLDAIRHPARGRVEIRDPWCRLASLSGAGGRLVVVRGDPPVDTLSVERHPTRASVQLSAMTADTPRLEPVSRGEERVLRLTLELLPPKGPSVVRGTADPSGPPSAPHPLPEP